MAAILLLAPGILAAAYYCFLKKISLQSVEFFLYCVLFIFVINLFVFLLAWLSGFRDVASTELFNTPGNVLKFGLAAGLSTLLFPNVLALILKIWPRKKHE